jgi:hypothetical protein
MLAGRLRCERRTRDAVHRDLHVCDVRLEVVPSDRFQLRIAHHLANEHGVSPACRKETGSGCSEHVDHLRRRHAFSCDRLVNEIVTADEKPIDRLYRAGVESLSDAELVSLLIDRDIGEERSRAQRGWALAFRSPAGRLAAS